MCFFGLLYSFNMYVRYSFDDWMLEKDVHISNFSLAGNVSGKHKQLQYSLISVIMVCRGFLFGKTKEEK